MKHTVRTFCATKSKMYFFKLAVVALLVFFATSSVLRDEDITDGSGGGDGGKEGKLKVPQDVDDEDDKEREEKVERFNSSPDFMRAKSCDPKNPNNLEKKVVVKCNKAGDKSSCRLNAGETHRISISFNATKEMSKATYITYHFCGVIAGNCLSRPFPKIPNFCDQLGCPLVEGKNYVVDIDEYIPGFVKYVYRSMPAKVSVRVISPKPSSLQHAEPGCILIPLYFE